MTAHHQPNPFEFSEADTCREYVTPAIQAAGWGTVHLRLPNNAALRMGGSSSLVAVQSDAMANVPITCFAIVAT